MEDNFYGKEYGDYFAKLEREELIRAEAEEANAQNPNLSPEQMKQKLLKQKRIKAWALRITAIALSLVLLIGGGILAASLAISSFIKTKEAPTSQNKKPVAVYTPHAKVNKSTDNMGKVKNLYKGDGSKSGIESEGGIIIDLESYSVVSQKNANRRLSPASLTKIMTLLVAVENIEDFDAEFTMTYKIINPIYGEASMAGFSSGEVLTVNDLLYGTVLPSGGEAAVGLAWLVSGDEDTFVALMNEKVKKLGLKNTHFENCTGLYGKNHYTTAEDMAVIFKEALKNERCKEILTTQKYVTSKTRQHPNGLTLMSDLFLSMKGDEAKGATVLGGKTGFVSQAGFCLATYAENTAGDKYICITLNAPSKYPAFYDHINIYTQYLND